MYSVDSNIFSDKLRAHLEQCHVRLVHGGKYEFTMRPYSAITVTENEIRIAGYSRPVSKVEYEYVKTLHLTATMNCFKEWDLM